jgi:hypothetical protein
VRAVDRLMERRKKQLEALLQVKKPMSIYIEYFFNSPKSISELAKDINACVGCSLALTESDPDNFYWCNFLSMELYFNEHKYDDPDDVKEIDVENFKYQLSIRTSVGDADARPVQLPAMALLIYALHRWYAITGILVYAGQVLLARYEERDTLDYGKRLYDSLSGMAFIKLSDHLAILKGQFPESDIDIFF